MMEYKVATGEQPHLLELEVERLIEQGFKPVGGVTYCRDGYSINYAQAMTKEPTYSFPDGPG